jgi:hypothetical protein
LSAKRIPKKPADDGQRSTRARESQAPSVIVSDPDSHHQ